MPSNQGTDTAGTLIQALGGATTVSALGNVGTGAIAVPNGFAAKIVEATLTLNATITMPAPVAGDSGRLVLTQDGTGSRTGTFVATSGAVKFVGGSKTLSTAVAAIDVVDWWSDGTNIYATLNKAYA